MKSILIIAAIAVTGCSKKSDTGSGASDDKACVAAIGKAVDTMIDGRRKMVADQRVKAGLPPQEADMTQLTEVSAKLRGVLVTRCIEDKWPTAVVTCFTSASDFATIKKCEEGLTPEQNRKRQQEVMKVMMGGRMTGGPGGPHPGMPAPTGEPPASGSGAPASGSGAPDSGSGTPESGSAQPPASTQRSAGSAR